MSPISRLVLRVDGNAQIGLGHLVRSLALADIVGSLFAEVVVLTQQPPAAVHQLIAQAHYELIELPAQRLSDEVGDLLTYLNPHDVVVLDGYGFNTQYQQQVRATGARVVIIDDLQAWPIDADLVINHGPGVVPGDYVAPPTTRYCLGPAFSLLRRPFREQACLSKPILTSFSSALICFGGADPLRLTQRVVAALLEFTSIQHVSIVIGSAATATAKLLQLAQSASNGRVALYHNAPAAELAALLRYHDVAVVPASTVLLEALILGRPALTGYYTENQRPLAAYVHAHQQAFSVGNFADLSDNALREGIKAGLHVLQSSPLVLYAHPLRPDILRAEFQLLLPPA